VEAELEGGKEPEGAGKKQREEEEAMEGKGV
jgi:hypothetical protein